MLSIKEISNQIGLPYDFLRRSIKALEEELKPFLIRGENNSILLDESAMGIIDQIKTLKDRGFTVTAVAKEIKKELPNQESASDQTTSNQSNPEVYERLLESEKARHIAELEARDTKLESVQNEFKQFKSNLLLLTDGRGTDLQSIKEASMREAEIRGKRLALYDELRGFCFWQGGRKKKILCRLEELETGEEESKAA